jgi:hypothetical protein
MPCDEIEKLDQSALPRRSHAGGQAPQPLCEDCRGARRIDRRPQHSEPGENVDFRVVCRAAIPEGDLDQAAGVNPVAVVVGAWRSAFRACWRRASREARPVMAVNCWTIRPRLAPRLCHLQAAVLEWSRITSAQLGQASSIMVRPPPVHPDRLEWGSIRR